MWGAATGGPALRGAPAREPGEPARAVPSAAPDQAAPSGRAVIVPTTPPEPPQPGRAPRNPSVLLEDVDLVEARRRERRKRKEPLPPDLEGTPEDPKLYRKLAQYALPYRGAMLVALVMSALAATAKVGYFFAFEGLLRPIFRAGAQADPWPAGRLFRHVLDSLHEGSISEFRLVLAGLRDATVWCWSLLPPMTQLIWAAVFLVLLVLLEQANKYVQKIIMRWVSLDLVRNVRMDMFKRVMSLSTRFFQANHTGRLLSRITSDLTKLGDLLVDVLVNMFSDVFTVIASLIYVFVNGGAMVLVALFLAGVTFVPIQQLGRRLRARENAVLRRLSDVFQNVAEAITNQKIVKAFGAESHETERLRDVNDRVLDSRLKTATLRARVEPAVEIVGALSMSMFMLWGGYEVLNGRWEGEGFFAIVLALFTVVGSLRRLADTTTKFQSGLSSADRVATILFSEPEICDKPGAVELPTFHDKIVFDKVCFAYSADQPVLREVSFELPRGKTLAIVGHTGSGKSTIGDLVPRFYDVEGGAVRIDGHDLRDMTVASLRRQLAVVTQETVLFQGTIRSNIAYAMPEVSHADVEAAARAAHAHDFIARLPLGYDTPVGERGTSLSGGERQRLAIARALLSKAPILILDEATSALDTQSERLVQDAIDVVRRGHTAIIIAHRLSTIREADQILVLERGVVMERGNHHELMDQNGIYANMVRIQDSDRQGDRQKV